MPTATEIRTGALSVRMVPEVPAEILRCPSCGNLCNVKGIRPFVLRTLTCTTCSDTAGLS